MGILGVEEIDHLLNLWMIAAGERGKGDLAISELIDKLLDLFFYRSDILLAIGFVKLAGVAETTTAGTAAHDLNDSVVLRYFHIRNNEVLKDSIFGEPMIDVAQR